MKLSYLINRYSLDILSKLEQKQIDKLCVDLSNELLDRMGSLDNVTDNQFISHIIKFKQEYNILVKYCKNLNIWDYFNDNYISRVQEIIDNINIRPEVISITTPFPKYHFDKLGLNETSSLEDIQKAYRKLSLLHHPDKGGDSNEFIAINNAKSICINYINKSNI